MLTDYLEEFWKEIFKSHENKGNGTSMKRLGWSLDASEMNITEQVEDNCNLYILCINA